MQPWSFNTPGTLMASSSKDTDRISILLRHSGSKKGSIIEDYVTANYVI